MALYVTLPHRCQLEKRSFCAHNCLEEREGEVQRIGESELVSLRRRGCEAQFWVRGVRHDPGEKGSYRGASAERAVAV